MRIQNLTSYNYKPNSILFRSINSKPAAKLTEKYNINPSEVNVVSDKNIKISDTEKALLIEKVIEAHELALKNYNYGNISKVGYASNIGLSNGMWHLATNFNNTRNEISAICGERAAIVGAYNDLLKTSLLQDSVSKPINFKVKYIAMSSYKNLGEDKNSAYPCADCLSWLNTSRYFDNNTTIVSLEKNENTGKYTLNLNSIEQYLPYRNDVVNVIDKPYDKLDIDFSQSGLISAKQKGFNKQDIIKIAEETQQIYNSNKLSDVSNHNIAASIIANGKTFTAGKIDFSKRWYVEPALFAASKAIEKFGNDTKIDCICYAGNSLFSDNYGVIHNDGVVNIKTLGMLNTKYATSETLVITCDRDKINVRTIKDYMPEQFKFKQKYKI